MPARRRAKAIVPNEGRDVEDCGLAALVTRRRRGLVVMMALTRRRVVRLTQELAQERRLRRSGNCQNDRKDSRSKHVTPGLQEGKKKAISEGDRLLDLVQCRGSEAEGGRDFAASAKQSAR